MVLGAGLAIGVMAAPAALAVGIPSITQPTSTDPTTTQLPTISGTGVLGGDSITVTYQSGGGSPTTACQTTVSSNSTSDFTCTPTGPLPIGQVMLVATESVSGASVASDPVTVTIGASAVITSPAAGSTTANQTPTISGTGQPSDPVKVTDATGATICTATVGANGAFSCAPSSPLTVGPLSLTVVETDPDGSNATISAPLAVTIGATPPPASTTPSQAASAPPAAAAVAPAASTSPTAAAAAMPASVASGSGGTVAQRGVPLPLVAGLAVGGLALLGVAWRRRLQR
jgi:hypothetical protein